MVFQQRTSFVKDTEYEKINDISTEQKTVRLLVFLSIIFSFDIPKELLQLIIQNTSLLLQKYHSMVNRCSLREIIKAYIMVFRHFALFLLIIYSLLKIQNQQFSIFYHLLKYSLVLYLYV